MKPWRIVPTTQVFSGAILIVLSLHLQSAQSASSCETQCEGIYTTYKQRLRSQTLAQIYYSSCLNRCKGTSGYIAPPAAKPKTTAKPPPRTTTTTTTTKPPPIAIQPYKPYVPPQKPATSSYSGECGKQNKNQFRIIGGTQASECEFPWVVGVLVSTFWCGGSIIDKRHIVTAAHCMKEKNGWTVFDKSKVTVLVGSSKTYLQTQMAVARVQVHPKHVPQINDYDVAILTLEEDLEFSDCVAPICLPSYGESAFDADYCLSAGWGITYYSPHAQPTQNLRKVTLPLVTQRQCENIYSSIYINNLKICAGDLANGGVDTCRGDSGGPLMCKSEGVYTLYGIVSFGSVCAAVNRPGIYTNVANPEILGYINSATKDVLSG